jgi:hypothetical protein
MIRLFLGIAFYLDLWYCPVYLVTHLWNSPMDYRWISILVFPFVQYLRCQLGIRLARKFNDWNCCIVSLLGVAIFLIQTGIISLTLSFIESIGISFIFIRTKNWSTCSPLSLFHLFIVAGSLAALILTLII